MPHLQENFPYDHLSEDGLIYLTTVDEHFAAYQAADDLKAIFEQHAKIRIEK